MRRKWMTLLLPTILIICMVVIGSSVNAHGPKKVDVKLRLLSGEFFFMVDGGQENAPIILKAGERVQIYFENIGFENHMIHFGRGLVYELDQPDAYEEDFLMDVGVQVKGGDVGMGFDIDVVGLTHLALRPEARIVLEFTVPKGKAGEWELGCFVPKHYEAGMHSVLNVIVTE